jgi:hypothetical protein
MPVGCDEEVVWLQVPVRNSVSAWLFVFNEYHKLPMNDAFLMQELNRQNHFSNVLSGHVFR